MCASRRKPGYVHGRGRRGGPAVFEQQLGGTVRPVRRTSRWPTSRPLALEEACRALDRMSVRTLEGDLPGGYGVYAEHAVYQGDRWWPPLSDRTTDEPGYGARLVSRYADRGVSIHAPRFWGRSNNVDDRILAGHWRARLCGTAWSLISVWGIGQISKWRRISIDGIRRA